MKQFFIFLAILSSVSVAKAQTSEIWRKGFTISLEKKDSICLVESYIMNKEHIHYDTLFKVNENLYSGKNISYIIKRNKHYLKIHIWPFKLKLKRANAADIKHLNYNKNYILRRNTR